MGKRSRGRAKWRLTWGGMLLLGAAVIVVVMGLTFLIAYHDHRNARLAQFQYYVPRYVESPAGDIPPGEAPRIRGKVIPVTLMGKNKVDDKLFFDLPEELQPNTPDEVGTVAWLEWEKKQVAWYKTDHGKGAALAPAYVLICHLTVIDRARNLVVARRDFEGGQPPDSIGGLTGEGVGSSPAPQIVDYLRGLAGR
jgi:hypothetical protein